MADILERLRTRQGKFAKSVKGSIEYNSDDERIDEDAGSEIARLRGIEAKLKELFDIIGSQERTLDLDVPLVFRDLKNRLSEPGNLTKYIPVNNERLETAFAEIAKIAKA